MNENRDDKIKVLASVLAYAPMLVLRVGYAYLRLKRRVRRSSRSFEKGMLARGIAPDIARRLALQYEGDFRTRIVLNRLTGGSFPRGGTW